MRDATLARFNTLQEHAAVLGLTLRSPPPEPTTCCGRGCNGCVWEGFYDAAQFWVDDAMLALNEAQNEAVTNASPACSLKSV